MVVSVLQYMKRRQPNGKLYCLPCYMQAVGSVTVYVFQGHATCSLLKPCLEDLKQIKELFEDGVLSQEFMEQKTYYDIVACVQVGVVCLTRYVDTYTTRRGFVSRCYGHCYGHAICTIIVHASVVNNIIR